MERPADAPDRAIAEGDLETLRARHPAEWDVVSEGLLAALSTGRTEDLARHVAARKAEAARWRERLAQSGRNPRVLAGALPHLLRERLLHLALQQAALALATHQASGTVRLGLWSGSVIQRLLFRRGLERKPASLAAFRFWWPLVPDRRLLMPLVQPKGIYCFYSRELVRALAQRIAGRRCLEIAAGDGTLSRFLREAGVAVVATDDASWAHAIQYPADVDRLDAREALRRYAPEVVICSWPPPGNAFEKLVFETPSVDLYVVIGSRHPFAAGNPGAYAKQTAFEHRTDEDLSRLVLPPEVDPAVLVFRRRA